MLVAKVPPVTNQGFFPKTDFQIDLETMTCTCPAAQTSDDFHPARAGGGAFHFAAAVCAACPLRRRCVRSRGGRTIAVHPQEGLFQEARRFQDTPGFRDYRARRQVVEHRLARLVQLGVRQARYFGRRKTLLQLLLVATVANLTLLAATSSDSSLPFLWPVSVLLGALLALRTLSSAPGLLRRPARAFNSSPRLEVAKIAALRLAS